MISIGDGLTAALALLVASSASATQSCLVFGLPSLGFSPIALNTTCAHLLQQDVDGDGIQDWSMTLDGREALWLMPANPDLDGDGCPNAWDASPLGANQPIAFQQSRHTVREVGFHSPIVAFVGTNPREATIFTEFAAMMDLALPHFRWETLTMLHALMWLPIANETAHSDVGPRNLAHYSPQLRAILLSPNLLTASQSAVRQTLAHELGHALVFSYLTGADLAEMASRIGPWKTIKSDSLWNPQLLQTHPLRHAPLEVRQTLRNAPTRRSLDNRHEWAAEILAAELMARTELGTAAPSPLLDEILPRARTTQRLNEIPSTTLRSSCKSPAS